MDGDRLGVPVVEEISAAETHPLRRQVLRAHRPGSDVDYPSDHLPGSFHLGIRDERGTIVATASMSVEHAPGHPGERGVRLRGMAVAPELQGRGLGGVVLEAALERLRQDDVAWCWANARTTAVGFYRSAGFAVVGEEFESIGLPHVVVLRDLRRR